MTQPIVSTISEGNAGIYETVARMLAYIRNPSARVMGTAREIIAAADFPSDPLTRALLLYTWALSHLVYVKDGAREGVDAEVLHDGDYLLREIANYGTAEGDCDDYVILLGSLFRVAGVPSAIMLSSSRPDKEYDHVWLLVIDPSGPVGVDGIRGDPFGWHAPLGGFTALEGVLI